jgi:hypothetical protein
MKLSFTRSGAPAETNLSERTAAGLILCDYVDVQALEEMAEQLEVRLAAQTQLAEKTLRGSERSFAPKDIGVKASRGTESGLTRTFGPTSWAVQVMAIEHHLRESHELADFVGDILEARMNALTQPAGPAPDWPSGMQSENVLHVEEPGRKDLENAHERDIAKMHERDIAKMRTNYSRLAPDAARKRSWIVIDADWSISVEETHLVLRLDVVRYYDAVTLTVGDDLPIAVDFGPHSSDVQSGAGFTQQGRRRLRGRAKVQATVFGYAESYDETVLTVSPIAVYERKGLA